MSGTAITVDARKALAALDGFEKDLKNEVIVGIVTRLTRGVYAWAFDLLSGDRGAPVGDYPVPVRTGHLRRQLYLILPGGRKEKGGAELKGTFGSEKNVGYVGNAASYAGVIHDGRKDGRTTGRPFLTHAARQFMGWAPAIAQGEIEKAVKKHGLT